MYSSSSRHFDGVCVVQQRPDEHRTTYFDLSAFLMLDASTAVRVERGTASLPLSRLYAKSHVYLIDPLQEFIRNLRDEVQESL